MNNTAVFRNNKGVIIVKSNTNNVVITSSRKNIPTLINNTICNCNTNKVYNNITKNDVKDNRITTSIIGNTFDNGKVANSFTKDVAKINTKTTDID